MLQAFRNGRLLTDHGIEADRVLLVRDDRIEALLPATESIRADRDIDLAGHLLAPGFIDTQVNGGGGVLFNDTPTAAGIATIGRTHRRFGTTGFLPTLISDDLRVVEQGMQAVREAIAQRQPGVLGIHIEGPFLAPERRGVHDAARLRRMDAEGIELLSQPIGGVTLVTLAPEAASPEQIRALSARGVIVAAGHSDASYADTQAALAAGVRGFTHLFNAMSPLGSREPGMVGAALASEAWCGVIVDGQHVHPATLKIALRARRRDRFMLVTDAMPSLGTSADSFPLQGRTIYRKADKLVDGEGRLAGAQLDMAGAVRNAVELLGLELEAALRLASRSPAEFLRLDSQRGRLAVGQYADLVQLDARLDVVNTWIGGEAA